MQLLPHWCITDNHPAFYDTESATAIEMVGKVYAAMNMVIEEYNKFADTTNSKIIEFMNATDKNYEVFTLEIRQEFQDFIDTVDLHIQSQDAKINDAVNYMKNNIEKVASEILAGKDLNVQLNYDEETEELTFNIVGGE